MPKSERADLIERLRLELDPRRRFVPCWAQLRVHDRGPDGRARKTDILHPRLWGGLYDRLLMRYVDGSKPEKAGDVYEISCHAGQLPMLLHPGGKLRVLVVSAPGWGKTEALVRKIVLEALEIEHSRWGLVGPTDPRLDAIRRALRELLEPSPWLLKPIGEDAREIPVAWGAAFVLKTAQAPSYKVGTSIQGQTWNGAGEDESQNISDRARKDVNERGRTAGMAYTVYETATIVDGDSEFIRRAKTYRGDPDCQLIEAPFTDNPWVPPEHWERLKRQYGDREFSQRIGADLDVKPEHLTYFAFEFGEPKSADRSRWRTLRPRPRPEDPARDPYAGDYEEITARLVEERFRLSRRRYILGTDPGILVSATEVLRCWWHKPTKRPHWWVVDEIWSGKRVGTRGQAMRLARAYDPDECVVIIDPHETKPEYDRTDRVIFEQEGLTVRLAGKPPIRKKARIAMHNDLLGWFDGGTARQFIDVDEKGDAVAPKLVEACLVMQVDEAGNPESERKDYRDKSHWPAGLQWGLLPFEGLHGSDVIVASGSRVSADPLVAEAERYARGL
jgi:hypothetical protein